ncbi:ly6/PLAUR domain-containing protein 6 isoform X2 [Microcaecilia unicolor]|uniref:Ly6/PLAUR domain-containing protein 6 isoform X2 n=1 Tax=Microcaecilia unicolor TaxID=1415580 RepID=A0A6P7YSA7_9AMPH|nr:ly6/PLAUR domain-containing protein 6 isoform X2 [Microcaecilia unicolor]
MEPWPGVAWVLLLSFIADLLKTGQSRDFTVKDIINLHPSKTRYCYTQHIMDTRGESISVTKYCVPLERCLSIGCKETKHEGHKICTSCCEGNICNLALPRNATDAVFATTSPVNQTERHLQQIVLILSCLSLLWMTTT